MNILRTIAAFGALLVSLVGVSSASASVIQTASFGGHTYHLLSQNTWTASETEAVSLGGHLVTINDAAENAFVYSTFTNSSVDRALWIGFTDQLTPNTFAWVSGEPITYTNWSGGEPNDSGGGTNDEMYVHMWQPKSGHVGTWNDFTNSTVAFGGGPLHGVVEVVAAVPAPATLTLLASAAALIAPIAVRFRRR